MLRILIRKYLHETLLLWSACALVLVLFPWVRIWAISQFELSGFGPLVAQLKAFEKFAPVPLEQFLTYEGVIGLTFAEPVLLLCVLTFAIARGSDVVSGELGRGTMEMLLAQPISRVKMLVAHGLVSVTGLAGLCVCAWIGIHAGIATNSTPLSTPTSIVLPGLNWSVSNPFVKPEPVMVPLANLVSSSIYIPSTINLFALGLFVFCLSVAVSSCDQYRWRTIGIIIGIYIGQLLLFILSKSTPRTKFLMSYTFIAAYQPDWMVQTVVNETMPWYTLVQRRFDPVTSVSIWEIGPLGFSTILFFLAAVLYTASLFIFRQRDLPAP